MDMACPKGHDSPYYMMQSRGNKEGRERTYDSGINLEKIWRL